MAEAKRRTRRPVDMRRSSVGRGRPLTNVRNVALEPGVVCENMSW